MVHMVTTVIETSEPSYEKNKYDQFIGVLYFSVSIIIYTLH
jgi:hypothetical protein